MTAPHAPPPAPGGEPDRKPGPWGSAWPVFWTGLLVRLLYIALAHSYRFSSREDHFTFGYEMARVARSLVTGYGYADPFSGHTGPTSWVAPLYPLLIAGIFRVFGVYSIASAWMMLGLNSLFSAATAFPIYRIADRCYSRKAAIWSAWVWALYPPTMQYAVRWVWETPLSTLFFACSLAMALRIRGTGEAPAGEPPPAGDRPPTVLWMVWGGIWGMIALSNPALLLFLPVCGVWMLCGDGRALLRRATRGAAPAAAVFLLCIAPWTIRNWIVFHAFIPMRGNLGAELYAGNGPGSLGFRWGTVIGLPERDPQHVLYAQIGEPAYVRRRGAMAIAYIRSHPRHFAVLTLRRFYFFWAGVPHPMGTSAGLEFLRQAGYCLPSLCGLFGLALSLRRRIPAAGLFAWAFALVPSTYYLVTVEARFRHPLDPLIAILSVYLVQSAAPRQERYP